MLPKLIAASLLGSLLSSSHVNAASSLDARWINPSDMWYGADGNWSSFPITIGTSGVSVDVLVSTTLAETWVVPPEQCPSHLENQDGFLACKRLRGGLFNHSLSKTWDSLGLWDLGLGYLNLGGDGDYGADSLGLISRGNDALPIASTAIAAINVSDPYVGLIGLGLNAGTFGQKTVLGAIDSAAKISGSLPSRSYGYTAGAYYARNGSGSPASLTLGGYDEKRFQSHPQVFYMQNGTPILNVRGIEASKPSLHSAPIHWNSTIEVLVRPNDSIKAIVDTTTPDIWLPASICDRFAAAFNLVWDENLSFYRLGNTSDTTSAQYASFYGNTELNFTFSLSDVTNNDNFGDPLNQNGIVNITVPIAAFTQLMSYPNANISYDGSSIPYFPLKRAGNGNKIILGRSFMQEVYMVTQYDPEPQFSLYQVVFPDDPNDVSIKKIDGPFGPAEQQSNKLSTSQLAGIVFAACAVATIIVVIIVCRRKRKKARQAGDGVHNEDKDALSNMESSAPTTLIERLLSLITVWKRPKRRQPYEVEGSQRQAAEVAADEDHQRYELPAPVEPVELDCDNDRFSVNDTTEFGSEDTRNMTAYELAQRKIQRQLQGPVPAYTPPADGTAPPSDMKPGQDVSLVEHYQPPDNLSPVSLPTVGSHSSSAPSPLSPHPDWPSRALDLPSPMTIAPYPSPHFPNSTSNLSSASPPIPPNTNDPSPISRSNSSHSPPRSLHALRNLQPLSLPSTTEGTLHPLEQRNTPSPISRTTPRSASSPNSASFPPSPMNASPTEPPTSAIQRTPIDPSRVVCLGPLPDNVQLPQPHSQPSLASIPRVVGPDGHPIVFPLMQHPEANVSVDTLGSNFTEEEEQRDQIDQQDVGGSGSSAQTANLPSSAPPAIPSTTAAGAAAVTRAARMRHAPPPVNTRIGQLRQDARQEEEDLPRSPMRIDSGLDIVHVPQLAEKRYSWEDDRT